MDDRTSNRIASALERIAAAVEKGVSTSEDKATFHNQLERLFDALEVNDIHYEHHLKDL